LTLGTTKHALRIDAPFTTLNQSFTIHVNAAAAITTTTTIMFRIWMLSNGP
jgi:hypothetical protein